MRRQSYRIGRHWLATVCLALAVQSLFPAGYMPASLADGWPVMLCPDGLPPDFLPTSGHHHGAHHDHGDEAGGDPRASDDCALGKALQGQALPAPAAVLPPSDPVTDIAAPPRTLSIPRRPETARRARAPPAASLS